MVSFTVGLLSFRLNVMYRNSILILCTICSDWKKGHHLIANNGCTMNIYCFLRAYIPAYRVGERERGGTVSDLIDAWNPHEISERSQMCTIYVWFLQLLSCKIYLFLDILHKIPASTVNCCEVEMDQQWNPVGPSTGQSLFMLSTPSVSQKSITAYHHGNLRAPPMPPLPEILVNNPLIRPWGGWHWRGTLRFPFYRIRRYSCTVQSVQHSHDLWWGAGSVV